MQFVICTCYTLSLWWSLFAIIIIIVIIIIGRKCSWSGRCDLEWGLSGSSWSGAYDITETYHHKFICCLFMRIHTLFILDDAYFKNILLYITIWGLAGDVNVIDFRTQLIIIICLLVQFLFLAVCDWCIKSPAGGSSNHSVVGNINC